MKYLQQLENQIINLPDQTSRSTLFGALGKIRNSTATYGLNPVVQAVALATKGNIITPEEFSRLANQISK
jgi:hypothetical protein